MLKKICTSYALSKEAYDKGIRVESLFSWYDIPESEKNDIAFRNYPVLLGNDWSFSFSGRSYKKGRKEEIDKLVRSKYRRPAPTASEWLELLPEYVLDEETFARSYINIDKIENNIVAKYIGYARFDSDTLQDALCKLAIKLKEEGIIS